MAEFSRIDVYSTFIDTGMVPVFYDSDIETAKKVLRACYEGGVKVFEFTNRGSFAHEVFSQLIKWSQKEYPEIILGIGSVMDAATASLYLQMGANFIVSPFLDNNIMKVCNRRQIACIPGCGSVSEICYAQELGAEIVKIFPAISMGIEFIKNIMVPMPWTNIMVTGGIEPVRDDIKNWITAGAACIGIGSKLFSKDYINNEEWNKISELSKNTMAMIAEYKINK